MVLLELVWYY